MLIYPHGLLNGERIALCSDEAQLHFPRLAALANGLGRMKLSEKEILSTAYGSFNHKPSRDQLTGWFLEYRQNHLLLLYAADDGSTWGQWCGIPDNALPRYKTSADNRSPAPPPEFVSAFDEEYAVKKRERSEASGDSLHISEVFGSLPKASRACEAFPPVVVVVGGVVVGEKHIVSNSQSESQHSEVFVTFPMKDGSELPIQKTKVAEWQALYPAVNGEQAFRDMAGWLIANSNRRKTVRGLDKFINTWLKNARRDAPEVLKKRTHQETKLQLLDGRIITAAESEADGWVPMRGEL